MTLSMKLDLAIKAKEATASADGYVIKDKGCYSTYMTNAEWDAFKNAMSAQALEEYGAGGGGELYEKDGRPPKMACYGSSSRMIYLLSRDKEKDGFHYEKKLSTTVGGTANLDGFLDRGDRYVLIEAKCHEPYSAKAHSVSHSYEALYTFINENMAKELEIAAEKSKCGRYLNVTFRAGGEMIAHFDLKQMICHLLGAATGALTGKLDKKKYSFLYLLYDPTALPITEEARAEIDAIYKRTVYECGLIDFKKLFRVILAFLQGKITKKKLSEEDVEQIANGFTFTLASQNDYRNHL